MASNINVAKRACIICVRLGVEARESKRFTGNPDNRNDRMASAESRLIEHQKPTEAYPRLCTNRGTRAAH